MARTSAMQGVIAQEVGKIRGLEASTMIVDEASFVDWSKLTTAASGAAGVTITDGSIWRAAKELMHSGVKYKAQTFEDRPTVFGAPLRISWAVPRLVAQAMPDAKSFERDLTYSNGEKLKHAIAKDAPDCVGCPHCSITVKHQADLLRDERQFVMDASCANQRGNNVSVQCPSGKSAVRKGSTALVADLGDALIEPHFNEIPGTSVSMLKPEPYISADPDKPTSDIGTAW